jgi:hypothetical protein
MEENIFFDHPINLDDKIERKLIIGTSMVNIKTYGDLNIAILIEEVLEAYQLEVKTIISNTRAKL